MNTLLKILILFPLVLKANIFSAVCEIEWPAPEFDEKIKPPTCTAPHKQQVIPVALYCGRHKYFFACATTDTEMKKFYTFIYLLAPKNSSLFLHKSIPVSTFPYLPKDYTRDGFIKATRAFVIRKIIKGSFKGTLQTIDDYVYVVKWDMVNTLAFRRTLEYYKFYGIPSWLT